MVYAFSLDVDAEGHGPYLRLVPSSDLGLRHLFEETIVTMPEGLRCDVPRGRVHGGAGEIGEVNDPASCWLGLRVCTMLEGTGATLSFEARGVINFEGGIAAFRSDQTSTLKGSAFFSSMHEASIGTFRWIERRQLFAVGRVSGHRTGKSSRDSWMLRFTFDLYAAL
jgi:hypothetical protein